MLDPNLSRTISQVISVLSVTLTVPGFGTPLLMVAGAPAGEPEVASYSGITELLDAGYTTDHLAYKKAQVVFAQNPAPDTLYVAKRTHDWTKKFTLTINANPVEGGIYFISFNDTKITYTAGATPTISTVATALAALVMAPMGFTAVAATGVITLTAIAANTLPKISGMSRNMTIKDVTTDPGLAADLAELLEDPSINQWYGLLIDSAGATEFDVAATFAEANGKFCALNCLDSGCGQTSVVDDVFSVAKAKSQMRTIGYWQDMDYKSLQSNYDFIAEGIMSAVFPLDAGSETWKFKKAANVTAGMSRSSWINAVLAKNGNTYTGVQGANITEDGKMLGGEWADIIRGKDWLDVEIQISVFGYLVAQRKVSFDQTGIDAIVALIKGALSRGVDRTLLVAGSYSVQAPTRQQVSPQDRAARILQNIKWQADLAGAIHFAGIEGALTE